MRRWLILFLIAAAGLAALLLGDAYYRADLEEDNRVALTRAAQDAGARLDNALLVRIGAVRGLRAFMLATTEFPGQDAFDRYAASVLDQVPDLRALQYVDPDLTIKYVYPITGNEAAVGLDLTERPAAPYVFAAVEERRMTINDPVRLVQGPLGSVIRIPLFRDDDFLGLVQGVMVMEPLLAEVAGELDQPFAMQLRDSGGNLFWGPDNLQGDTQMTEIEAGNQTWTLAVGWAQGAPGPDPFLGAVLWGLGTAFLLTLLLFVSRTMTRTDWLAEAVETRTAELASSERKYRTLVEQANDAIVITDTDGNYLEANSAALRMLGYERKEMLALNARDIVPETEQAQAPLHFTQLESGESLLSERWLQSKDGQLVPVESNVKKLPDGRYLGILRDITERKETEEALHRREAILQAVSFSAEQFLRSGAWRRHIDDVLARLGKASVASRAYIFQNERMDGGRLLARHHFEWVAPGIVPKGNNPRLQTLSYDEAGAGQWRETLARGRVVAGPVTEFPQEMQALLTSQEVLSVAAVPIFAGDEWWGFMGFDECRQVRIWSEAEIGALKTAADILGAAISRERNERRIRQSAARAEALVRTAARLNDQVERDAVLDIICEEAQHVLGVPVAVITLYDSEVDAFTVVTGRGLPPALRDDVQALPSAIYQHYTPHTEGTPLLLEDVQSVSALPHTATFAEYDLRTVLFARLEYDGRVIGGLLVATFAEIRSFSREEQELLVGLADQAAQAITHASLFEETRRLLQQTREQARQVQQIMETVPEGVILLNARRRILLANPAGREYLAVMTNAEVGDVLERVGGRPLADLLAPDSGERTWRELQLPDSDRIFELTERSIEAARGRAGWVLVIREVTAERQRQAYVLRQERLATVGQLAAGIAHDFNNIMAIITLYSQSLERDPESARRTDYLQTISKQARHAADLIGQILDFSRRAVMERGRLDLLPFVKEIVKLLQRTLPETITIGFQAEEGEYVVNADPTRLQQVLMNLALNARDAMLEGGELLIRLASVKVRSGQRAPLPEMAPGEWIRLTVLDTGSGISPRNLEHIFEPFFSTKKRGEGTGLGLAQVYGIVKQHGGEIDVESRPDVGTAFIIYLPAIGTEVEGADAHGSMHMVPPANETILLVEDNRPTRQAIRDTLEMLGYRILVAGTGEEALELFQEHRQKIDLVLSDIVMPEMGGVELYHNLRQLAPEIKMMVMTGYPLEDEGRSLLEEGIITWIRKPFSQDEIAARIRAVLDAETSL